MEIIPLATRSWTSCLERHNPTGWHKLLTMQLLFYWVLMYHFFYIFIRLLLWQYFFINTRYFYFLDLVPHQIKITPLFYCLVFLELNCTSHLFANIKAMTSNMSRIGVNFSHRLYIVHQFYAYIIPGAYLLICFVKRWKLAHNLHFVTVVQLLFKYRHQ